MKLKRRIAGFLLAVCMTAGLLPAEISAAGNNKAIQLVDRDSGSAANISGGQVSSVYYGTYRQSSDGAADTAVIRSSGECYPMKTISCFCLRTRIWMYFSIM